MIKYCEIDNNEAKRFLNQNRAYKEQISVSDADFWLCAKKGENYICGVIGIIKFKDVTRIKAFFVDKNMRKKGIGIKLLESVIDNNKKMSAFVSDNSLNLFIKNGFVITKEKNKNGIYFLEREVKNV